MCSREEIVEMGYKLFDSYDKDNSGFLDRKEVKEIFDELFKEIQKNMDCSAGKTDKMFGACDLNGDNKLTRKEFTKILELFLEPVYL
jgi:Ca2+-binding EF-hand superfamily protein